MRSENLGDCSRDAARGKHTHNEDEREDGIK
jgi:hypothetical protein